MPVTQPTKHPENGGFGDKITPLTEIFQNSSITVQYNTPIDVFPEFYADLSHYNEMRDQCNLHPLQKHAPFAAILHPFGTWHQNFNM